MKKDIKRSGMRDTVIILFVIAALMLLVSFFIADIYFRAVIRITGFGLLAGIIIAGLFGKDFGYKPTLEEIEEKQFGDEKQK